VTEVLAAAAAAVALVPAVSGLWYILLIAVGICMMMTLAHNVRKDPGKMARVRRLSSFLGSSMRKSEEGRRGRDATGTGLQSNTA
jgi:hypothetical protein